MFLFFRSTELNHPSRLFFSVLCLSLSSNAVAEESIQVGGTGTGTLLMQRIIESHAKLKPKVQIKAVMPPMGSNGSLRALEAGAIQLAIVTFPSIYTTMPEDAGKYKITFWARTPFVFTGHDISNDTKLTLGQVAEIYSGQITQWPNGTPVRLITRTERESDTRILRAISPEIDAAVLLALKRTGMPFAENDVDNLQLLEMNPGSFGTIALGQLMLSGSILKPARLDGVLPSPENLQSGKYRYAKPLYLVTTGAASPATLEFIKYLQSTEVVKLIRRYGFITKQD
ncbi:MAG: substrate-binding domain-containing protein [Gallionella sp.]